MKPTISFAITACNEHDELERLLCQLESFKDEDDEVIVQLDSNATSEVRDVLVNHPSIKNIEFSLNKDFATFKNNIKKFATKDYIFYIDADEFLNENLVIYLKEILKLNPEIDLYYIPRWNTVNGLTQRHIDKWRWRVDTQNRINFPDYQSRLVKNKLEIRWDGKVHERIIGHIISSHFSDDFFLIHPKDIKKQEKQNELYDTI
jgi:glycosyltransferase involved in cell wall biosynthesis